MFEDEYSFYFVSEYQKGGDLWNALMNYGGKYTEEIAAAIVKQLLEAVNYLHKKGIVHRNIRPGNILFNDVGKLDIKLIDFDVAGTKTIEAVKVYGGGILGPYYCAPEIFGSEVNEKCDIWSIGVLLYFLLYGSVPFWGYTNEETIDMIVKGIPIMGDAEVTKNLSPDSKHLISQLLTVNIIDRLSAEKAL